jgi:hypothetical protein
MSGMVWQPLLEVVSNRCYFIMNKFKILFVHN